MRLDEERVGDQPQEGSDIGERIQAVRRGSGIGFSEPVLQQRTGGRDQQEWQADTRQ